MKLLGSLKLELQVTVSNSTWVLENFQEHQELLNAEPFLQFSLSNKRVHMRQWSRKNANIECLNSSHHAFHIMKEFPFLQQLQ